MARFRRRRRFNRSRRSFGRRRLRRSRRINSYRVARGGIRM